MKTTLGTELQNDTQLVEWSLTGDREAFGRIVERYQSLVCSITYGATGSLSLSEDIAQDTFITAWRQLTALNDATKLRAWLCGIARNLTNNSLRRGQHEPTRVAEPLEEVPELSATEPSPSAEAVSREEEAILWRALERIPDTYRQPLILFYREQQSVERVAEELELSEDAVKQRLSRGRKLLADEVAAFVEGTLQRTAPGHAFTVGVLGALPLGAASATTASVGAAVKSGGVLTLLAAWLAPVFGIFGGIVGTWGSIRAAETARERRFLWRWMAAIWLAVLGVVAGQSVLWSLRFDRHWSDKVFVAAQACCWTLYTILLVTIILVGNRRCKAIRREEGLAPSPAIERGRWYNLGRVCVIAGVTMGSLGWMIGLTAAAGDRLSLGIVTAAIVGLTWWGNNRARRKTVEDAEVRTLLEMVLLIVATTLVMVDWRLHGWIAATRGVALTEIQRSMPLWSVNLCAGILSIWLGALLVMTRPKGTRKEART
jgi:RNA polymerase sigma factor (sigma-70 family)